MGLRCQWAVQGHDVALGEQGVEVDVPNPEVPHVVGRVRVVGLEGAAEPAQDPGDDHPDPPRADDPHPPRAQVEAEQSVEAEVPLADPRSGPRDAAVERQHQRDGVFGDRVRRVGGHPGHGHPEVGCSVEVDVVEPGAAHRDHPHASVGEHLEHRP